MAEERDGFKFNPRNSDGTPVAIRKSQNRLAEPLDTTKKGIKDTNINEAFLNAAFPGRKNFYGRDNSSLVAQFERWVGTDESEDAVAERTEAMERLGVSNYGDWSDFGATPDLREGWAAGFGLGPRGDRPDPSLIDSPFIPSPTSPEVGEDGRPENPDIESGYGRSTLPDDSTYGQDIEERYARSYNPGFTGEKPSLNAKLVRKVFQKSIIQSSDE